MSWGRLPAQAMYLVPRNSSIPSCEPSRPIPDCLTPPKGAAGSDRFEIAPVNATRAEAKPAAPRETRSPAPRSPLRSLPRSDGSRLDRSSDSRSKRVADLGQPLFDDPIVHPSAISLANDQPCLAQDPQVM